MSDNRFHLGEVTRIDAEDPYAVVLADLQAQRERIDAAIVAIQALRPFVAPAINEASQPPPRIVKRVIPTDPAELKAEAIRMSHSGFGLGEVKAMLELNAAQMLDYFGLDV